MLTILRAQWLSLSSEARPAGLCYGSVNAIEEGATELRISQKCLHRRVIPYDLPDGFDLDGFLVRPLIARIATNGPTIRPVWYIWEEGAFWWLTGSWSQLPNLIERDPAVVLLIDTWEPATGDVIQLIAKGRAEMHPFEGDRARRKLARYLGADESRWDTQRFQLGTFDNETTAFVRLHPDQLVVTDLSYKPPS